MSLDEIAALDTDSDELQHEEYKRPRSVRARRFDVVLYRATPAPLQSERIAVASFNDEERAEDEAAVRFCRRNDKGDRYFVVPRSV